MNNVFELIDNLDISLFNNIESQTSKEDRLSLLAIQRVTTKKHKQYTYLEIGSHLGGTIQPHLVDSRCSIIYSIDPRPLSQPDDRTPGYIAYYEDNSTARMLNLLTNIDCNAIAKIKCFELSSSEVNPNEITEPPLIAFIDGEHTNQAVLKDYWFCSEILNTAGTIAFHDFNIIYPAILEICGFLQSMEIEHIALKLGGTVFAIFFDPEKVYSDPFLKSFLKSP